MKKTIRAIFVLVAATLILAGCKKDEKNPPVAGFTVSNETLVQWDKATITSTATGADEETYEVTGGAFEMDEATLTIQFLEAATYTITQTATNVDGTVEASQDVTVTEPDNTYNMSAYGTSDLPINGDAYWFSATQIRMDGEGETTQETDNTVKTSVEMGLDPFYGSGTRNYVFDAEGGSGTYIGEFTHYPATGDAWDAAWGFGTTSAGDGLEVTLIYAPEGASDESDYVYDITMSKTTIDGYYDGGFGFHEETSFLTYKYRGKITPLE
ncbi:MAG: hypothetical protein KDC58_00920 [Cyclobacteriaceae bacterium]|nr:hypothetical protein [Cyclobacteriaceae bacterium]